VHRGEVGGTQGRYLYIIIPLLLIGFVAPAFEFLKNIRWKGIVYIALSLFLIINELTFYADYVFPLYFDGRFVPNTAFYIFAGTLLGLIPLSAVFLTGRKQQIPSGNQSN
jgi:hypothetical protein